MSKIKKPLATVNNKYHLDFEDKVFVHGNRTPESVVYAYRIIADKEICNYGHEPVMPGDKGGYIESEKALSFEEGDTSWIYGVAEVTGKVRIEGNSTVDEMCCVDANRTGKGILIRNSHIRNLRKAGPKYRALPFTYVKGRVTILDSTVANSTVMSNDDYSDKYAVIQWANIGPGVKLIGRSEVIGSKNKTTVIRGDIKGPEPMDGNVVLHCCSVRNSVVLDGTHLNYCAVTNSTIMDGQAFNGRYSNVVLLR